ncbi:hypothetical protein [Mongoliibacter sp.]|nr:hypothetical protein [Mongoliibacter sp.]
MQRESTSGEPARQIPIAVTGAAFTVVVMKLCESREERRVGPKLVS